MITYVNTVFVSNLEANASVIAQNIENPAKGQFVFVDVDTNAAINANTVRFKIGMGTGKTAKQVNPSTGATTNVPVIKWSNIINVADIKGWAKADYAADTEDVVTIDFTGATTLIGSGKLLSQAGKRIIVRLTFKDMPHRFRKWTESYEYMTKDGDTKAKIVSGIANMINKEWKRARVQAIVGSVNTTEASNNGAFVEGGSTKYFHTDSNFGTATATTGTVLQIIALPYDDDDAVDTLNVANKVRFNVNIYWTDPSADGWESKNKHFPEGAKMIKVPGKAYPASAKLVRDREAWAMGYQGILNRGEGTWPVIKPDMETQLDKEYNALTLEFENMYRAADDIQRKTKQVVEIYSIKTAALQAILNAFVDGVISSAAANTTNP